MYLSVGLSKFFFLNSGYLRFEKAFYTLIDNLGLVRWILFLPPCSFESWNETRWAINSNSQRVVEKYKKQIFRRNTERNISITFWKLSFFAWPNIRVTLMLCERVEIRNSLHVPWTMRFLCPPCMYINLYICNTIYIYIYIYFCIHIFQLLFHFIFSFKVLAAECAINIYTRIAKWSFVALTISIISWKALPIDTFVSFYLFKTDSFIIRANISKSAEHSNRFAREYDIFILSRIYFTPNTALFYIPWVNFFPFNSSYV